MIVENKKHCSLILFYGDEKMSKDFDEKMKQAFADFLEASADKGLYCDKHKQNVEECDEPVVCSLLNVSTENDSSLDDFDFYARDINDFVWLKQFIPNIVIYSAGGSVPFQAEGYLGDLNFYYRERGGIASLNVANSKNESYSPFESLYSATLTVDEFRDPSFLWYSTLMNLIEQLEKPVYLYQFQCHEIDYGPRGNRDMSIIDVKRDNEGNIVYGKHSGKGFTKDEAFNDAVSSFERMRHNFCDRQKYDRELEKYVPSPELNWSNEEYDRYVELINIQPIVVEVHGNNREYPVVEPIFEVFVPEAWRNDEGLVQIPDDAWRKRD